MGGRRVVGGWWGAHRPAHNPLQACVRNLVRNLGGVLRNHERSDGRASIKEAVGGRGIPRSSGFPGTGYTWSYGALAMALAWYEDAFY